MMRARLFADGRETVQIEETDDKVTIRIKSAIEALRLSGLFLAARRYGDAADWDTGKDIVVKYGLLRFSI